MKRIIILTIFLLLIAGSVFADDKPYHPCQDHVCLVAFDFGYGFGFGSNSGGSVPSGGPTGDRIQLETGDFLLTEDSKYLIQE